MCGEHSLRIVISFLTKMDLIGFCIGTLQILKVTKMTQLADDEPSIWVKQITQHFIVSDICLVSSLFVSTLEKTNIIHKSSVLLML